MTFCDIWAESLKRQQEKFLSRFNNGGYYDATIFRGDIMSYFDVKTNSLYFAKLYIDGEQISNEFDIKHNLGTKTGELKIELSRDGDDGEIDFPLICRLHNTPNGIAIDDCKPDWKSLHDEIGLKIVENRLQISVYYLFLITNHPDVILREQNACILAAIADIRNCPIYCNSKPYTHDCDIVARDSETKKVATMRIEVYPYQYIKCDGNNCEFGECRMDKRHGCKMHMFYPEFRIISSTMDGKTIMHNIYRCGDYCVGYNIRGVRHTRYGAFGEWYKTYAEPQIEHKTPIIRSKSE